MNTTKGKKREDFSMAIAPNDGHKLSKEEKDLIKEDAKVRHAKRSPECLVRNEMLSVLYRVEEYLQQENLKAEEIYTIEYFVGEFCKVLGLNKSQFANYLDTDISNLNKYLKANNWNNRHFQLTRYGFCHLHVLQVKFCNIKIKMSRLN